MKTPPSIDLNTLLQDLDSTYGIRAQAATFIPRGEMSWGYHVESTRSAAYFLKIYRETALPAWAARLTYRLHDVCQIEQVSHPLPARSGEFLSTLAGFQAAVFPFIEGQSLWEVPHHSRQEVFHRLGQLLAQIHRCRTLTSECLRVERFEAWGLAEYRQVIEACSSPQALPGAAGEALNLLRPLKDRLANLLDDLLRCQQKARQASFTHCICHGDPTPGNILVTPGGLPYLIDWDDTILAPRERDLVFWERDEVFFENESSSPVLEGYRNTAGDCDLNPDVIGFYRRQWTVGEIAAFSHRLLFESQDEAQNQSDLENLQEELKWLWN